MKIKNLKQIRRLALQSSPSRAILAEIRKYKKFIGPIQAGIGIGWIVIFLFGPLLYIVSLSFLHATGSGTIVTGFTLENYYSVLINDIDIFSLEIDNLFIQIFWQSLKYALVTTVFVTLLGYIVAYYLGRKSSRWKILLLILVILPFWTPTVIRYYAWSIVIGDNGFLVYLFNIFGVDLQGISYSTLAVVSAMIQVFLPFMILPSYNSINDVDSELIEAAKTLGATPFRTFREVTFVLSLPGVLAGMVLVFIMSLGTFLAPSILGGPNNLMIANLITSIFQNQNWPLASAMAVIYLLVLLIVVAIMNNFTNLIATGENANE